MKNKKNSFLSDQCRAIILGSLLGDGSLKIHRPHKNARFSFRHSIHQKTYFLWKIKQLSEITSERHCWLQENDTGYGKTKLRFQSLALPELTELYRLTHKKNVLNIRRKWLNQMNELSLAIWWLDDGSIIGTGSRGVICTDGFSHEDNKLLARYFLKVWGIEVKVGKIGSKRDGKRKEYFRLWIRSSEELKKLLRIILPHVPVKEMLPKVLLLYKDSQLQQRWISEVTKKTSFSKNAIEKALKEKKSKWKRFQKMI